jgi:hypothetical protein
MQGGSKLIYDLHLNWSDNCQLTMQKKILIMKTFLGALSICNYSARIYTLGV